MSSSIKITSSPLFFFLRNNNALCNFKEYKHFVSLFGPEAEKVFYSQLNAHKTQSLSDWLGLTFLSRQFSNFSDFVRRTYQDTSDSAARLKVLIANLEKASPHFAGFASTMKLLASTTSVLSLFLDFAALVLCLYYRAEFAITATCAAKLAISLASENGRALVQKIISTFYSSGVFIVDAVKSMFTTQGAPTTTGPASACIAVFRSLIGLQTYDDQQTTSIINKLRAQIGFFKDMNYVVTFFKDLYASILSFFGYSPGVESITDISKFLLECEQDVVMLGKAQLLSQFGKNKELAATIRERHAKLNNIRQIMSVISRKDAATYKRYTDMLMAYTGAMLNIEAFDDSHKNRSTPPIVHFYGAPGVGKSVLVRVLAHQLHRHLYSIPEDKPLSDYEVMYCVNPNDSFRDAYKSQTVYYFDDPNQNMDTDSLVPFLLELIAIGQDTPYQLPMANVENKAAGFFNSPFAFFSTNDSIEPVLNMCSNNIQDLNAIRRRITYSVKVLRPGNSKTMDDYSFEVTHKGKTRTMGFKSLRHELVVAQARMASTTNNLDALKVTTFEVNDAISVFDTDDLPHKAQGDDDGKTEFQKKVDFEIKEARDRSDAEITEIIEQMKNAKARNHEQQEKVLQNVQAKIRSTDSTGSVLLPDFEMLTPFQEPREDTFALSRNAAWMARHRSYAGDEFYTRMDKVFCFACPISTTYRIKETHPYCADLYISFERHTVVATRNLDRWSYVKKYWDSPSPGWGTFSDVTLRIAESSSPALAYHASWLSDIGVVFSYIQAYVKIIFVMAAVWIGAHVAMYIMVSGMTLLMSMFTTGEPDPVTQLEYPKDHPNSIKTKVPAPQIKKLPHTVQGGDTTSLIYNAQRQLAWVDVDGKALPKAIIQSLAIKQGFLLFPHHFLHFYTDKAAFLRVFNYSSMTIEKFPADKLLFDSMIQVNEDAVLLNLGKRVSPSRDILHHFMTDSTISTLTIEIGQMLISEIVQQNKEYHSIKNQQSGKMTFSSKPHTYGLIAGQGDYVLDKHISFEFPTKPGQCGFPYVVSDKSAASIAGIHVSGNMMKGCGVIVSRDTLTSAIELFTSESIAQGPDSTSIALCDDAGAVPRVVLPGRARFIKTLPPALAAFLPTKPSVVRNDSMFNALTTEECPETRLPSLLRPIVRDGVPIDPLQKAISKIGDKDVPQKEEHTVIFKEVAKNYRLTWPEPSTTVVLTEKATLNGLGAHFKAITPKKSAGINQLPSHLRGKYSYITCAFCHLSDKCVCVIKEWELEPETRLSIQRIDDALARDAPPEDLMIVFNDVLKSELRKESRVKNGESRLFSVGPFELLFLARKYFGPFMDVFNANPEVFSSGIGLNPHSSDWKTLHDRLLSRSKFIFADAKNWDANMRYVNIMIIHEEINNWFALIRQEHIRKGIAVENEVVFQRSQRVRLAIAKRTYRCYHLIQNVLYVVEGNPSGQALTGIINTLYNNVATRSAIVLHHPKITPSMVFSLCEMSATGDDIVLSHDLEYTCQEHANSISNFGIILTPADKSPVFLKDYYTLYDGDYLKRKFRPQQGLVFAPLEKLSVLGMCNYKSPSMSDFQAAKAVFDCFQIEAMHYGKEFFIEQTEKFQNAFASNFKHILPVRDYQTLVGDFMSGSLSMDFSIQSGENHHVEKFVAHTKTAAKVASSKGALKTRAHDQKNGLRVLARNQEGKSFSAPKAEKMNSNKKAPQGFNKPQASIPFDAEAHYADLKAKREAALQKSHPKKKDIGETLSKKTELDMVMEDWSLDSKPKIDKGDFVKKNPGPKKSVQQNKIAPIPSLNPFYSHEITPAKAPSEAEPLEPLTAEQLAEQNTDHLIPLVQELPNSFITTMPSHHQKLKTVTTAPLVPHVNLKKALATNLKKAYRPTLKGNAQTTVLMRFLNMNHFRFTDFVAKYNLEIYRTDGVFKNTCLHYASNNLGSFCAKTGSKMSFRNFPDPISGKEMTEIKVEKPDHKEIIGYGVDIDPKNQRKFACLNTLIALDKSGEKVLPHWIISEKPHVIQSGYTGEKAPVDDPVTQIQNSKVQEATTLALGETKTEALSIFKSIDPYHDMTPMSLLEREILIGSFSVTSATAAGALIVDLSFPDVLLTYYGTLLNRFAYFMPEKSVIKVRLNSNFTQQGLLHWSYEPLSNTKKANFLSAPVQILQHVANAQSVTMEIPSICYNTGNLSQGITAEQGHATGNVLCHLLSPIREANVSTTVSILITIYLSMVNPKCYGFRTQSGDADLPTAVLAKALPTENQIVQEASAKKGNVSAALDSVSDIASVISVIPQARPFASSVSILSKLAGSVTRLFGHSNSRNVAAVEPCTPRSIPPLSMHHGIVDCDVLGMSVDASLATDDSGSKIDFSLYDNLKLIPMMYPAVNIGRTTPLGNLVTYPLAPQWMKAIPFVGHTTNYSPSCILADQHENWRGGQKVVLVFVGNRLGSARVRVWWQPPKDTTVPTTAQVSDYVNRIVNVNGPTVASFTIPFLGFQPFLSTDSGADTEFTTNGHLHVELLTTPQLMGTVDVPIQMLTFMSSAEDMVFTVPSDTKITLDSEEGAFAIQSDTAMVPENLDLVQFFRTTFDPIIDASSMVIDKVNMSEVACSYNERYGKPTYLTTLTLACSDQVTPTASVINLNFLSSFPSLEIQRLFTTFGGYKGGLYFTFIPRGLSATAGFRLNVQHRRGHSTATNLGMRPFAVTDPFNRFGMTVLVPDFNNALFRAPGHPDTFRDANELHVRGFVSLGTPSVTVDVLFSFAEDFKLLHYSGITPA